ncbi:MAG: hypothetical protein GXP09_11575 [Gammaproteobacteria bacterium]|nr:hypothetical protein [Gammaproteobacteria bacterium]
MAKKPKNSGQPWTSKDMSKLRKLVKGNTPTGLIAYELERSEGAVYSKAAEENISLKPTNQSPYNRQKT